MRFLAGLAIGAIVSCGALVAGQADATPPAPIKVPLWVDRPCPQEDSVNCSWDHPPGHPFMVRKFPHRTCWMYFEETYSQRHDHCRTPVR